MQGFALPASELDRNGDGLIQPLEANAGVLPAFERADVDGDDVVTIAEHVTRDQAVDVVETDTAAVRAEPGALWRRMDADGDGGVTLEEYLAFGMARYERATEEALSDPDVGIPVEVLTRVR